ncbi:TetR/AcrR family transcriptional regulator [Dietzia sp. SL131]|uniref:TetR/AcrR family transcriptional regulator n=1 Tax=Dietzia sp. SL131 TaxID=2995149 RepID=UPI00227B5FC4|nr:TetR/AcrR family transcriptional regulator [Dietzia sp. SL131]MCY1657401.1 TetR/AcrR family transcriptional regulator [Dietzia sp. SL131]
MADSRRAQVPIEQRRRELTETAVTVMARDGAWALTTRALAKEAGVPHGSVHYAFKDELMRSVLRVDLTHLSDLVQTQQDRPVHGPDDVTAAVAELFAAYADSVLADPMTEIAYFELSLMAARDEQLRALAAQSHQEYRRIIVTLLSSLAERAGLRWDADVVLVAEQAMTLMFGAALGWFELRDDALFRAVLDDAAGMVGRRLV